VPCNQDSDKVEEIIHNDTNIEWSSDEDVLKFDIWAYAYFYEIDFFLELFEVSWTLWLHNNAFLYLKPYKHRRRCHRAGGGACPHISDSRGTGDTTEFMGHGGHL